MLIHHLPALKTQSPTVYKCGLGPKTIRIRPSFVSLRPVLWCLASPGFSPSRPWLGFVRLRLCAGGLACCLLCGGLRDEDQYLLRHSSPALDQDSPCGQHMLLVHLEHQNKEQLQCTLARLENENRSASTTRVQ